MIINSFHSYLMSRKVTSSQIIIIKHLFVYSLLLWCIVVMCIESMMYKVRWLHFSRDKIDGNSSDWYMSYISKRQRIFTMCTYVLFTLVYLVIPFSFGVSTHLFTLFRIEYYVCVYIHSKYRRILYLQWKKSSIKMWWQWDIIYFLTNK